MISKILFLIGVYCLSLYGFFMLDASYHQQKLQDELEQSFKVKTAAPAPLPGPPARILKQGDLFGRLEIPRLDLSVMVMEGDEDRVLDLGAGHIPGTDLAIAGHRDTFFRPLKDIKVNDTIRITTPEGVNEYRVTSTKIVGPHDTYVLDTKPDDELVLVTCYPFYYVGPAPKRFIVEAAKN